MPYSPKQRRAAFAEIERREKGGSSENFSGMSIDKLKEYAHSPLEKKKKRGSSAGSQADALRQQKGEGE